MAARLNLAARLNSFNRTSLELKRRQRGVAQVNVHRF